MKKIFLITLLISTSLFLASCSEDKPLTESEQAQKYNMTTQEFQETKEAAARMNMTIDDHMKMTDDEHNQMQDDMENDDSHMIEDDMEMEKNH